MKKFTKGYARVYCGGHLIAQIRLADNPVEIAPRPLRRCPECGSDVGLHGCSKHHKEKVEE